MTKWIMDITASGVVDKSLFDANTILKADTDNTPEALTVAEQRLVGRITSGEITALTAAQVATLIQASIDHGSLGGLTDDDHTQYIKNIGGLYGINVEALADAKTLTAGTDEIYQYLDPGGASRIITLDTASATAGDRFVIRNMDVFSDVHYLQAKQGDTEMDKIYANDVKEFIFDGTNWEGRGIGTRGADVTVQRSLGIGVNTKAYNYGVAVGPGAEGHNRGVAVGYVSTANTEGVAVGYWSTGGVYGVAVGHEADAYYYGVAVGWHTNSNQKMYSIALGYRSETERYGETSINIDGTSDQENNVVQGRWSRATANDTPVEMFLGEQSNQRFTIRASSALAFTMKIVARDNVAGEVAMYAFEGLIKRDAANNTTMSVINKAIIHEDDATWDVAVTADDTNEALIITVTGDAANATQWAAVMDGVETHF